MANIPCHDENHYLFHEVLDEITLSYVISAELDLQEPEYDPMDLFSERLYESSLEGASSVYTKKFTSPHPFESSNSSSSSFDSDDNTEHVRSRAMSLENPL
jgi:hypothetical protein